MKRVISLILIICLLLCLSTGAAAASEKQHDYSSSANSGIRYEICTSLLGTSADSYYTGEYTYDNLSRYNSEDLLTALRTLMTNGHTLSSYSDCRDEAVNTDCENGDGVSVSLIYTGYSATWDDWCNNRSGGWDREHVWPKSLGGFGTTGPGADLHHVRPCDSGINSSCRNNRLYGNVSNGKTATGAAYTGGATGGTYNNTYFEPIDSAKGDVARICLYLYARWGADSRYTCNSITNVFESVDVLLEWCALDPVDTWEMGRNEVVYAMQGNRNVFIDYPELAWLIFDERIPTDMVTPSGEAKNSAPCSHDSTTVKNASSATCTKDGYTGDTYCKSCGEKLSSGSSIAAKGHTNKDQDNTCDTCGKEVDCGHGKTELRDVLDATCGTEGHTGDTYCVYCDKLTKAGDTIPATGEHNWNITQNGAVEEHTCTVCGYKKTVEIPTEPSTAPTEPSTAPTQPNTEPSVPVEPTTIPSDTTAPTGDTQAENTSPSPTSPVQEEPAGPDSTWIVVAGVAIGAWVIIMFFIMKKKKSE